MALLLSCESVSKSFGARPLFNGISLSIAQGERAGMIGPNGSGKSTLLKIFAGLESPDTGTFTRQRDLKLGYLAQEDLFEADLTVEEALLDALADSTLDEHERHVETSILLSKLEFSDPEQTVATLSGGWKKRLAIARMLIRKPELVLMDEPTNHLDVEGILWLEKLLISAQFAVLLVSHDRYFLENVTNRTIELNRAYADGFLSINGPYSAFIEQREAYLEAQASRQQSLASRVRREVEWLHRGAKARTTKAKGRIEEAGRMMNELAELKVRNAQDKSVEIEFTASGRKTRKLLTAQDVRKSLGGRLLFDHLNLVLSPGTKLGILGANGSGKTTLLRLLDGSLEPDHGKVTRAGELKIVRFDQARQRLDKKITLRDALSPKSETVVYRGQSIHITSWAKQFLFRVEQLDMPVGDLSGGEQARILIAQLMLEPGDMLILDEPTNDLDIPSLQVLEDSLADFPGALVLVTHDRFMLDRLSTELLALDGKGGAHIYADLSQWENALDRARDAARVAKKSPKPSANSGLTSKPDPALKKLSYMELRDLEQMEEKIMLAEQSVAAAHQKLEDPKVIADHIKFAKACTEVESAQEVVANLYARWETLESRRSIQ